MAWPQLPKRRLIRLQTLEANAAEACRRANGVGLVRRSSLLSSTKRRTQVPRYWIGIYVSTGRNHRLLGVSASMFGCGHHTPNRVTGATEIISAAASCTMVFAEKARFLGSADQLSTYCPRCGQCSKLMQGFQAIVISSLDRICVDQRLAVSAVGSICRRSDYCDRGHEFAETIDPLIGPVHCRSNIRASGLIHQHLRQRQKQKRRAWDSNPQPLAGHHISSVAAGQFAYPPGSALRFYRSGIGAGFNVNG
jgi:hypothetical protein